MKVSAPPTPQPTAEELAAAERARRERIEATQENLQTQQDDIFRNYIARGRFGML